MTTDFKIDLAEITRFGSGLARPECVACTAAGVTWVSHAPADSHGGVARLDRDGNLHPLLARRGGPDDLMPNGWSMAPGGAFVLANLGRSGGVWHLSAEGECTPLLLEIDGVQLPPVNFVHRDELGRLWISVSTWRIPRDRAFHRDVADGFVIRLDERGARVVADGLGFTNEVKLDPRGEYLYANETMARRLSRYAVTATGLGPRQTVVEYLDGIIPDGFEFDSQGGVWCASVMSNRLLRVAPDGAQHVMLDDSDPAVIDDAMARWRGGHFCRDDLNIGAARTLRNIASVTFGGPDLKTVYLGSLFGDALFSFRSPIAGATPPHWRF